MANKELLNVAEKNSKKRVLVLFALSFILTLGAIATAVIIPYASTQPMFIVASINYNPSMLTSASSLDADGKLVLLTESNAKLVLSSTDEHVNIGDYSTDNYLFCDKGSVNSNVSIEFSIENLEYKDVVFTINVCREDGTDVKEFDKDKYEISKEGDAYTASIRSTGNIFIKNIKASYKKRVR